MEKIYKLTHRQLVALEADAMKLAALESGGVDNWSWYGDSLFDYKKDMMEDLHMECDPTIISYNELAEAYINKAYTPIE